MKGYDKVFELEDRKTGQTYQIYTIKEIGKYKGYCPICAGFSLLINEKETGYICQKCGYQGKLRLKKKGVDKAMVGKNYQKKQEHKGKGTFVKAYDYKDETGKLKHQTVRYKNPKGFSQRRPKKGGGWIWDLKGVKLLLYRLSELLSDIKKPVLILEGEKDCDLAYSLNFIATTCPMGALKWRDHYNQWLAGREIILIPDLNDIKEPKDAGIKHMKKVGNSLIKTAKEIKWLELPNSGEEGFDLSKWYAKIANKKGASKALESLIKEAPEYKAEPELKPKTKKRKEFNPRPYSQMIMSKYQLLFDKYRRFWFYDSKAGIWKENFPLFLNEKLRKEILAFKDLKKHSLNEIISDLEGLCFVENRPDEPEPYLIPFKNKIYDLKNKRTLEYDPKYFFINKLAVNYNPKAKGYPLIQEFFEAIVPEDDIITLKEMIAYCYYRGYPYPKSFWLYGIGANGKSRYAEVMRRIIGKDNISAVSLSKLQESKFGSFELYGKLINISPELSRTVLRNTTVLKQVTGEDQVNVERKFKDPFPYVNYAKLVFLSNEIPWSEDKSFAFYRRIFLIEFPNLFEIALKADTRIIKRIPKIEFEALAYECLGLMKDLYSEKRDFAFLRHKRTMDVQAEYEKVSDPLGMFLEEKTKAEPEGDIPVISFNTEFKKWQKAKMLRTWTDREISQVMSQKGIVKRTKRISSGIAGKDFHYYKAYLELVWKAKNED